MLSKTLKELEQDGIIVRHQYNEVPPHVDYTLTKKDFLKEIVKKINSLDHKYKVKFFKTIGYDVNRIFKQMDQEKREDKCKNEGHEFSEWEFYTWKEKVIGGDLGEHQEFMIDKKTWERSCTRCGFKEMTEIEPESVKAVRLEKEKTKIIKRLKKELKRLENE